jgi:Zn-finger nucleic acid-binding protein
MNCPKCASVLTKKYYKGMMEIDYCPNCRGMWLDFNELDQLEDMAFDEDRYKGSLIHRECNAQCNCPACAEQMHEFQYRLFDLKLELCPNHHGFWLDAGEDERVIEIMRAQQRNMKRKIDAESDWKQMLKGLHTFFKQP